jgi:hypothetical protein
MKEIAEKAQQKIIDEYTNNYDMSEEQVRRLFNEGKMLEFIKQQKEIKSSTTYESISFDEGQWHAFRKIIEL